MRRRSSSRRPSSRPKARRSASANRERAKRWGRARPRALGTRGRRS
jgi:hypothetical protein